MEQQGRTKIIHYTTGVAADPLRPSGPRPLDHPRRVSCAVCSALLRERRQRLPAGLKQGAATDA